MFDNLPNIRPPTRIEILVNNNRAFRVEPRVYSEGDPSTISASPDASTTFASPLYPGASNGVAGRGTAMGP